MKDLFYGSLFMLLYIYLGYPALVWLIGAIRNQKIEKGDYLPEVTIIIAAYNEEKSIEETLRNKLSLNYPKEKLEIIVVSDSSYDRTDAIVKDFEQKGIRLLRQEPRLGKTAALNLAVPQAKGGIIIFSDGNSIYEPDSIQKLVRNFYDPTVGYATGKMIYTNLDGTVVGDGCTAYMRYENFLRKNETKVGSIVGVDGAIDAVRKELYQPMERDQLPDFVLPLKVIGQGFRVVYEPEAIVKEASLKTSKDEYKMRVRVSLRALWALSDLKHLLSFKKYKIFAWQILSHKWLRYLGFLFLIGVYISNLSLLTQNQFFKIFFVLQNLIYVLAIWAFILENKGKQIGWLYLPFFFTLVNLSSAHAFVKLILGQKQVVWEPRKGS